MHRHTSLHCSGICPLYMPQALRLRSTCLQLLIGVATESREPRIQWQHGIRHGMPCHPTPVNSTKFTLLNLRAFWAMLANIREGVSCSHAKSSRRLAKRTGCAHADDTGLRVLSLALGICVLSRIPFVLPLHLRHSGYTHRIKLLFYLVRVSLSRSSSVGDLYFC